MTDIKFLGEENFLAIMETKNKAFIKSEVKHQSFTSFDGTRLCCYIASPDSPKGAVVFLHGFGEFFGKFREYVWYLFQAGYKVFFLEHRGHGSSEGKLPEHDVVYIDSFDTYVEDLHMFIEKEVLPASEHLDLLMIAHSMGGCIGTLFLEKYPDYFKAAILSSPMFRLRAINYPPIFCIFAGLYTKLTGKSKNIAPGQPHFNPYKDFENSSARSKARFDYQLAQRREDKNNQTTGASISWALAAMIAIDKAIRNATLIHIPVTVMTAGDDHLIDPAGYELFKKYCKSARFHHYENSRHELFNSDDESRKCYFADVIETLDNYNAG
ncbi:MAG: alpha/beta hydrolase [Butyrivibrio sp.]|nr:alpha/beta hydrolase [Butyrivibrio sp.]